MREHDNIESKYKYKNRLVVSSVYKASGSISPRVFKSAALGRASSASDWVSIVSCR